MLKDIIHGHQKGQKTDNCMNRITQLISIKCWLYVEILQSVDSEWIFSESNFASIFYCFFQLIYSLDCKLLLLSFSVGSEQSVFSFPYSLQKEVFFTFNMFFMCILQYPFTINSLKYLNIQPTFHTYQLCNPVHSIICFLSFLMSINDILQQVVLQVGRDMPE